MLTLLLPGKPVYYKYMANDTKPSLKRVVGMPLLALYGIGNIVGAGVYVLVGKIAEPAGYLAVLAFLTAAIIAFCAALSYAELAARFPVSAGAAVYLNEAFKKKHLSILVGCFLVSAGIVSTATLLKGFSGYFGQLVAWPGWLSIVLVGTVLMLIMLRGIKESVGAAALLTILEVGGLIFLVGSILLAQPDAISTFNHGFSSALQGFDAALFAGVISGAFIAFYAFIGFEDMVNIAEEVKEPQKAFPRAILLSMAVVTVLYIAVAIAALGVIQPSLLAESSAPLADAYHAATGNDTTLIVIVSLLATLNGILVNVIMGSRFLYGMSRRKWLPAWFSKVSKRHVPARGILLVGCIGILCALWLPIAQLAQITSFLLLCVFIAINVSLIVIRRNPQPGVAQIRFSPRFIPWLGTIASCALLIGQAWTFFA